MLCGVMQASKHPFHTQYYATSISSILVRFLVPTPFILQRQQYQCPTVRHETYLVPWSPPFSRDIAPSRVGRHLSTVSSHTLIYQEYTAPQPDSDSPTLSSKFGPHARHLDTRRSTFQGSVQHVFHLTHSSVGTVRYAVPRRQLAEADH